MNSMCNQPRKDLSAEQIKILVGSLEEIQYGFESYQLPESNGNENVQEAPDDVGEEFVPEVVEAEEIEVAIDAFISQLSIDGLIKKAALAKAPSIAEVFEELFGSNSKVVDLAREFAEQVEGYEGWLSYDEMKNAYDTFKKLKRILEGMRDVANS